MVTASTLVFGTFLALLTPMLGGWSDDWSSIREAAGRVNSLQAEFVQTKTLKVLKRPIVSKGHLYYQRPGKIRWEYTSPVKCLVILDEKGLRRYVWRDGAFVPDASVQTKPLQRVFQEMGMWLGGDFAGSRVFSSTLVRGQPAQVQLTPRDEHVRKYITGVEVLLSSVPGVVDSITIREGPDTSTRIAFSAVQLNRPIPPNLFAEAQ